MNTRIKLIILFHDHFTTATNNRKMKLAIFIFIISANISFAQTNGNLPTGFILGSDLLTENVLNKYVQFDFSKVWLKTENSNVYGIIGADHQRIRIKLLSAKKSPENPNKYLIVGISNVEENICDFQGTINLIEIYEVKDLHYGVDYEFADKVIKSQGVLIADYEFKENRDQNHSGIFKGILYTKWYLNSNNQIEYDDVELISDGYFNNAFVGIWENYTSTDIRICNWADYRVPNANKDFDVGVAEFNVSDKYWNKGWFEFAMENQMTKPVEQEKGKHKVKEWWE